MGGSGGGTAAGGGAGATDYPGYLKYSHARMLDHGDGALSHLDDIDTSVYESINEAAVDNPFTGASSYDPTDSLTDLLAAIDNFEVVVDGIETVSGSLTIPLFVDILVASLTWADAVIGDAEGKITADINAYSDQLSDVIDNTVLPKYKAGMRDINAVMSSSFLIGAAIISGTHLKDVAKYGSDIRLKMFDKKAVIALEHARLSSGHIINTVGAVSTSTMSKVEAKRLLAQYIIEGNRLKIVALKEKDDVDRDIDEREARWPLEILNYAFNGVAAIAGAATVRQADPEPGKGGIGNILGGAFSGAAAGGQVGGAWGAAGGAVLGGLLGSQK